MEEAVGKLTAWISSGPNWPYALVPLHKGTCHAPLSKEGHLGTLPQRWAELNPGRQISQLEVCQLLITGTQVVYPMGLNRCKESILTSLPESLAHGVSLTAGEPTYLEINILQLLAEESDQKVPPIGEVSTIVIARPHKFIPPKLEGESSMTMEVRSLLSQVMLDMPGSRSENSTTRRLNPVVALMPPPHKPKELLQPVDTLSQGSTEMAEASLEGKAACSTAIRDVKTQRASQAKLLQREHCNILWDLETQAIQKESRSQSGFLSASQATLNTSPAELKSAL